jgi:1,4-dihydroxy-2-naphthoyl-CoA hydrolase
MVNGLVQRPSAQSFKKCMPFKYLRTVNFVDTDGAGVVFFANVLTFCHGAYEAALGAEGFELREFFSDRGELILPIVRAEIKFYRPMYVGDCLQINLKTKQTSEFEFEIAYQINKVENLDRVLAQALTKHICLEKDQRSRAQLSLEMQAWLHKFS